MSPSLVTTLQRNSTFPVRPCCTSCCWLAFSSSTSASTVRAGVGKRSPWRASPRACVRTVLVFRSMLRKLRGAGQRMRYFLLMFPEPVIASEPALRGYFKLNEGTA